ncbi:MAG: hypothetical protein V1492_03075 [Candidatus Micrarchaeota archaeon]
MKRIYYSRTNQPGEQKIQAQRSNWLKVAPLIAALCFSCGTASRDGPVCKTPNAPASPSAKVAKAQPKERVRVAVCTTGCFSYENFKELMFLSHAYEVNTSGKNNYRVTFYEDEHRKAVLMEGVGDDSRRFFRKTVNSQTLVQETRKNAGVWMHVEYYSGAEAEQAWSKAIARYN